MSLYISSKHPPVRLTVFVLNTARPLSGCHVKHYNFRSIPPVKRTPNFFPWWWSSVVMASLQALNNSLALIILPERSPFAFSLNSHIKNTLQLIVTDLLEQHGGVFSGEWVIIDILSVYWVGQENKRGVTSFETWNISLHVGVQIGTICTFAFNFF